LCFEGSTSKECEYHFVFLNLIDLALMTPLAQPFHGVARELTWHDYHPGWRYAKLMIEFGRVLSAKVRKKTLDDFIHWACYHPRTLANELCNRLKWPMRKELYDALRGWLDDGAGTFPYGWTWDDCPIGYRQAMGCLDSLDRPPVYWHVSYFEKGRVRALDATMNQTYDGPVPRVLLVYSGTGELIRPFSRIQSSVLDELEFGQANDMLRANLIREFDFREVMRHINVRALVYRYVVSGTGKRSLANLLAAQFCRDRTKPWKRLRDAVQERLNEISQREIPNRQAGNYPPRRDARGGVTIHKSSSKMSQWLRDQNVIE